ncbi:MAG: DUF2281 domain-containing protein [Deinococcota bacterium]|jgi:hypothetical protein|nr:DUF2281 domain-containing protein [Deinococcota bacterium]
MNPSELTALFERLPQELQQEVLDFTAYLLEKKAPRYHQGERVAGLHEGQGWMSDDFDTPLPDAFWLGREA